MHSHRSRLTPISACQPAILTALLWVQFVPILPAAHAGTIGDDGEWQAITPLNTLHMKNHVAVYDALADRTILVGVPSGASTTGAFALDGSDPTHAWHPLAATGTPPPALANATAAWDPVRNRVILFGGRIGLANFNSVYALSLGPTPAWSLLAPSGSAPSARYGSHVIYDPVADRLVIFGGRDNSAYKNDVYALSLSGSPAWILLAPTGSKPLARASGAMVYDPVGHRCILFGGLGTTIVNDVWQLTLTGTPAWTRLFPTGTLPDWSTQHVGVYDALNHRLVVHGGFDGASGPTFSTVKALPLSGTLQWVDLTPAGPAPGARAGHAGIFDPVRNQLIVQGGFGSPGPPLFGDTWALSLSGPVAWSEFQRAWTLGSQPPVRDSRRMVYDAGGDVMVGFGGSFTGSFFADPSYSNDVWGMAPDPWFQWASFPTAGTPPHERSDYGLVADPRRDRVLLYGGYWQDPLPFERITYNDLWSFRAGANPGWTPITTGGTPAPFRQGHALVYDPIRDRVILLGGSNPFDVWELTGLDGVPSCALLACAGTPPSGRADHSAVYDPVRDRILVFGGTRFSAGPPLYALELSGTPTWVELTASGAIPALLTKHTAFYDPIRDRMIVYGGEAGGTYSSDAWALALSGPPAWTLLAPAGVIPAGRADHVAAYDPRRDFMLMHGGYAGLDVDLFSIYRTDTQVLRWDDPVRPSVACGPPAGATPGQDANLQFMLGNPLAGDRALEWKLSSARAWPGFPMHGMEVVAGGAISPLQVVVAVPDTAGPGFNTLTLAVAFAGATGNEAECVQLLGDAPTPALASLVSASAEPGLARVTWHTSATASARVERREGGSPWTSVARVTPDGTGFVRFEDETVVSGRRYAYRLAWDSVEGPVTAAEVWLDVPLAFELAFAGARPNPASGDWVVEFSLPAAGEVAIETFDVGGRRVGPRRVETLGAGRHRLPMEDAGRLAPGVYHLVLRHAGRTLVSRVAVVR